MILAKAQVNQSLTLPNESQYDQAQSFVNHAEGDLECTIALCEVRQQDIFTVSVLCYLLHQALEKWLKAYIVVFELPFDRTHSLQTLLDCCAKHDKDFDAIRDLFNSGEHEVMLAQSFPADLRYEMEWSFEQLLDFAEVLTHALVRVRQLVIACFW